MANFQPTAVIGSRGAYRWLTTGQYDLDTLLQRCPQAVVGKYVAVTSLDSGPMALTDAEKRDGWRSRNEIAYSPQIQSAENVRTEDCRTDAQASTSGTSLIPPSTLESFGTAMCLKLR